MLPVACREGLPKDLLLSFNLCRQAVSFIKVFQQRFQSSVKNADIGKVAKLEALAGLSELGDGSFKRLSVNAALVTEQVVVLGREELGPADGIFDSLVAAPATFVEKDRQTDDQR